MVPIVLLLAAAGVSAADVASDADAVHLIRAVGADRMALLGMKLSLEHAVSEGKATAGQLACIKQVDSRVFDASFVTAIVTRLSRGEIDSAIAFFESPLGVKYVTYGVAQLYRTVNASGGEPLPEFSQNEQALLVRFLNGPLGQKLAGPQGVFDAADSKPRMAPTVMSVYASCKGK